MLILAIKPGHDGGMAGIEDGRVIFSLESEKDSSKRYKSLTPTTVLDAASLCGQLPDVVALGGWIRRRSQAYRLGAGYVGDTVHRDHRTFFGKRLRYFSSTHERSHLMMALGMAPPTDHDLRTVLIWEGYFGNFYLVDRDVRVLKTVTVLRQPGVRYNVLLGIADPTVPSSGIHERYEDSGKLMALAAFGRPEDADEAITATVDRLMSSDSFLPVPKEEFRDSPVFNAGVTSFEAKTAAALLSQRMFALFEQQARRHLPPSTPLYISGGCGLNCDWNGRWRQSPQFSGVFVPPCTNDSGSAIGTGIDALHHETGQLHVSWDVYAGLPFDEDISPNPDRWQKRPLDVARLSRSLALGCIVAWVQGRWEIGPRALGNRSLLAEPFNPSTRDRLNEVKNREDYRPIAPCCRVEDVGSLFDADFEDPHMLYFRRVVSTKLGAVTHVDGTARVQTVSQETNPRLHRLLSAFADQQGYGVLCNTSLNFKGCGFINRMSDLVEYCDARGIDDFVVGDWWYVRRQPAS